MNGSLAECGYRKARSRGIVDASEGPSPGLGMTQGNLKSESASASFE